MGLLNQLLCFTDSTNTGKPTCVEDPGTIVGLIFIPNGKVYSKTQLLTAGTTLAADALLDSRMLRILPVSYFESVESAGDDRVQQTFGYGRKRTVRRGHLGWNFTMATGGKSYHGALMGLDGKSDQYDVLLVASGAVTKIIGTVKKGANGRDGLGGFDLSDLYLGDYTLPDGSNGYQWTLGIELADSAQFNTRYATVDVDFDVFNTVAGLQTARLSNETATPGTANQIQIGVNVNGVNGADVYGAGLAQTGAWTVLNAATGAVLTVSAVTQTVTNGTKTYQLTITAGTGITATVSLKAPSVLATLTTPVIGIESNTITVAIP